MALIEAFFFLIQKSNKNWLRKSHSQHTLGVTSHYLAWYVRIILKVWPKHLELSFLHDKIILVRISGMKCGRWYAVVQGDLEIHLPVCIMCCLNKLMRWDQIIPDELQKKIMVQVVTRWKKVLCLNRTGHLIGVESYRSVRVWMNNLPAAWSLFSPLHVFTCLALTLLPLL